MKPRPTNLVVALSDSGLPTKRIQPVHRSSFKLFDLRYSSARFVRMLPSLSCNPRCFSIILVVICIFVHSSNAQLNSSWPMSYPGIPSTPYGPDWQAYYEVNGTLPNVTFPTPRTYAGNISVNRTGHENNTLFFVAFEKEDGSLSAMADERADEPWIIWLNGGPGGSSLLGLFSEHGPLRYGLASPDANSTDPNTYTLQITENPWSWHQLSDIFYVDQPVGAGYSTVDLTGYVADEDQVGTDFASFLSNLVSVFPSLKKRPLHLVGESYAGTYIPYITKALIELRTPPVNLTTIAIGDGTMGNYYAFREFAALQVIQTYPQLIGFNTTVYEYIVDQYNLCGYNLTLKYPNPAWYPTLNPPPIPGSNGSGTLVKARNAVRNTDSLKQILGLYDSKIDPDLDEKVVNGRRFRKRQADPFGGNTTLPELPPKGVINSWYGCDPMGFILDWATNYTVPWIGIPLDPDRVADALNPEDPSNPSPYLNSADVKAALHAPNKTWYEGIPYPFDNGNASNVNLNGDPSPEPQLFLSDLAKHVKMVFYSGNDDPLVPHLGTELAIQNMTFGGIRGFTARPSTPFSDADGNFAGIVHQERGVTYMNFFGAGHLVPRNKPKSAYVLIRDFVLGSNTTGLLTTQHGTTLVQGGVHTEFLKGIMPGSYVLTGSLITQGTFTWAQESWDNWDSYMATRTAPDVPIASATDDGVISPGSLDTGNTDAAEKFMVKCHRLVIGVTVIIAGLLML